MRFVQWTAPDCVQKLAEGKHVVKRVFCHLKEDFRKIQSLKKICHCTDSEGGACKFNMSDMFVRVRNRARERVESEFD